MRTIPDLRVWLILAVVLGCVPAAFAANVTIEQGDTFDPPNSNTSITWGYDQNFSINQLAGYNDTLGIGDRNISVYAEDGGSLNVTVFDYNVSRPVTEGQEFLTFQIEPNDTADDIMFRVTEFPSIETGSYRVTHGGTRVARQYNGGTLAWTDGGWGRDNITVRYDIEEQDEDTGGGGGSIAIDPFCRGDAAVTNQHSWFTDKSSFVIDAFDAGMGLDRIEVTTDRNVSGFELCAQRLDTVSVEQPDGTVHAYYNLTSNRNDDVTAATVTFHVEDSFLENHDEVRIARYTGTAWTDLDADRIEPGVYQVELDGFSRFAVYGRNETDTGTEPGGGANETEGNETDGNESDGSMEPVCGDGQCTGNESWETCPGDCPEPDRVVEAESALNAAQGNISQDDPGYSALQQAETAYRNENYERAADLASQALEQHRETQQDGQTLPWLPVIAGILGLLFIGTLVVKSGSVPGLSTGEAATDFSEPGLDTPAHEVDNQLEEVSDRVRDTIQAGAYPKRTRERIYELLNEAIEAVQNEDYLKAKRVLDHLENVMDENT